MDNPFITIEKRFDRLETILSDLAEATRKLLPSADSINTNAFGDFHWLTSICPVPQSTLRQKSAKGEIPGVIKVGKRVLYEKAVVLEWLRSCQYMADNSISIEQFANEQFEQQQTSKRLITNQRKGGGQSA